MISFIGRFRESKTIRRKQIPERQKGKGPVTIRLQMRVWEGSWRRRVD